MMEYNTVSVEMDGNKVKITPIADIHKGNNNCKISVIERLVPVILKDPCHYVVGLGAWFDSILHGDKRSSATDKAKDIFSECDELMEIFAPIKHRILGLGDGNHEGKLIIDNVGSPIKHICNQWKIPYLGYSGFLKIQPPRRFHNRPAIAYYHHGAAAGRKTGGGINRLEELPQHWGADMYFMAHSHKLGETYQVFVDWNGVTEKLFVNTGGCLETCTVGEIGYGEKAQYPPQVMGTETVEWECLSRGRNRY